MPIYPEKISLKAARNIGRFYGVEPRHNGALMSFYPTAQMLCRRVPGLLRCHQTDQVCTINDFIASECKSKEFYGFGACIRIWTIWVMRWREIAWV